MNKKPAKNKSRKSLTKNKAKRNSFNSKSTANYEAKTGANKKPKPITVQEPKSKPLNMKYDKVTFIEVDEDHADQRIDNFLITNLKGVPKTFIYRIIRKGELRVNKGRVKQTTKLKIGDSIRVPPIKMVEKKEINIDQSKFEFLNDLVLFEDDALLILNKPSGMAVHAGSGIKVGVIEALRAIRSEQKYLELAHRLDRETSGCLVIAKKASALKILNEDFKVSSLKNKRIDKRYLALVKGEWKNGQRRVTKKLNTDSRRHGERHVTVDESGSYASSIFKPLSTDENVTLMEVNLLTGRTHQVRVHALSEHHPLAGDKRYGDEEFNKALKSKGLSRLFLHAWSIKIRHPVTTNTLLVSAPLSNDLVLVLKNLKIENDKLFNLITK